MFYAVEQHCSAAGTNGRSGRESTVQRENGDNQPAIFIIFSCSSLLRRLREDAPRAVMSLTEGPQQENSGVQQGKSR